jgi:hypothetical protein
MLLRIIEAQPTLCMFEDLGKRAKMEGCAGPDVVGPQEEGWILPTVSKVQELFAESPRALKRSQILIQLIQAIQHWEELRRLPQLPTQFPRPIEAADHSSPAILATSRSCCSR